MPTVSRSHPAGPGHTARVGAGGYCVVTAVLPAYRRLFLAELDRHAPGAGIFYAGSAQFDASVRTGVTAGTYRPVDNVYLLGRRLLVQRGTFLAGLLAGTTVVDLNPRSLTAWAVLAARAGLRRRVLVWGHVHPRAGRDSRTAGARRLMRTLADGTITYTVTDRDQVLATERAGGVWAAPNALFTSAMLTSPEVQRRRVDILYVGRLEAPKRVGLLVEAFALALPRLPSDTRLVLVGDGRERPTLQRRVDELHLGARVRFVGYCADVDPLRAIYAGAACSVSPGYVGLSLTQSLGFGVPMVVADDEPHAPEVELATAATVTWFRAGDADDLAEKLAAGCADPPGQAARRRVRSGVLRDYTAEAMAAGFLDAVRDRHPLGVGAGCVGEPVAS